MGMVPVEQTQVGSCEQQSVPLTLPKTNLNIYLKIYNYLKYLQLLNIYNLDVFQKFFSHMVKLSP